MKPSNVSSSKAPRYFVYMLLCNDNSLYTGYTKDISNRMMMHEKGKGSAYVFSRLPFKLVHLEEYTTQRKAMQREFEIKKLSVHKKRTLVSKGTVRK